jgi:hypothetical protein
MSPRAGLGLHGQYGARLDHGVWDLHPVRPLWPGPLGGRGQHAGVARGHGLRRPAGPAAPLAAGALPGDGGFRAELICGLGWGEYLSPHARCVFLVEHGRAGQYCLARRHPLTLPALSNPAEQVPAGGVLKSLELLAST